MPQPKMNDEISTFREEMRAIGYTPFQTELALQMFFREIDHLKATAKTSSPEPETLEHGAS